MQKFLLPILICCYTCIFGQITGTVTDVNGNPLPYAAVYLENSTSGTICNANGQYILDIPDMDSVTLVYQYIGYETAYRKCLPSAKQTIDVALREQSFFLDELVISAKREDPAYDIIRMAIANREKNRSRHKTYTADIYAKSVIKMEDMPDQFLGEKLGNLQGLVDSLGQGILYLSESTSKYYYAYPDQKKEVMTSATTVGTDIIYLANQFDGGTFDFYKNYIQFGRSLVSPIANTALDHYKYKLLGIDTLATGRSIYKISIQPKSIFDPLFQGEIFILDDTYALAGVQLNLAKKAITLAFVDSIHINQLFLPAGGSYALFSQELAFKANMFNFVVSGIFNHIFSNYNFDINIQDTLNTRETFMVKPDALQPPTIWETIRPIPLTNDEKLDYIRKDSLNKIWTSRSYMDSIDRIDNRFKLQDIFFGYTWNNRYKNIQFGFRDPLSIIRFNAVEGTKINVNTYWTQSDSTLRQLMITNTLQYGIADNRFKSTLTLDFRSDNYNQTFWTLSFGRKYTQFDPRQPISERSNTWNSLWDKTNKIRFYEKDFVSLGYKSEISNGFYLDFRLEYLHRKPLSIHSQYSWRHKNKRYEENIPQGFDNLSALNANRYFMPTMLLQWSPGQTYASLPHIKIRDKSDWPNLSLGLTYGYALDDASNTFIKLQSKVRDTYVNALLLGYFSYNIEATTFLGNGPSYFGDYIHQIGNEVSMPINPDLSSFNLLPYYTYSSNVWSVQYNFRHHFNGFLSDKLPLIRNTKLSFVLGSSALYTPDEGGYIEGFIGLENFKIGPLELFSIDYTVGKGRNLDINHGFVIRLSALFE